MIFHVCLKPVPRTVFRRSQCKTFIYLFLGALCDFLVFQKDTFWIQFWATKASKEHKAELPGVTFSRPCFSRNHGNYRATKTSRFFEVHLSNGDWLIVYFGCFSLCYALCKMCITCFHKTLINAEPLNPQLF